jgi:hypothetical protein
MASKIVPDACLGPLMSQTTFGYIPLFCRKATASRNSSQYIEKGLGVWYSIVDAPPTSFLPSCLGKISQKVS